MDNLFLSKYRFKRKLDKNYFALVDSHYKIPVCYFCLKELDVGQVAACSPECMKQLDLRSSTGLLRQEIIERDGPICAKCGINGDSLRVALRILKKSNPKEYELKLKDLKIPPSRISRTSALIDVDHIRPVSSSGGAGIDIPDIRSNCQILCIFHHLIKDGK